MTIKLQIFLAKTPLRAKLTTIINVLVHMLKKYLKLTLDLKKFNMYASGENFLTETITLEPLPQLQEIDDEHFVHELKSVTIQMWHNFISEHVYHYLIRTLSH